MAQQTINIGQSANDKNGDALRTAFAKVNANFTELYTGIASRSQLTNGSKTLALNADGSITFPDGTIQKTAGVSKSFTVAMSVGLG